MSTILSKSINLFQNQKSFSNLKTSLQNPENFFKSENRSPNPENFFKSENISSKSRKLCQIRKSFFNIPKTFSNPKIFSISQKVFSNPKIKCKPARMTYSGFVLGAGRYLMCGDTYCTYNNFKADFIRRNTYKPAEHITERTLTRHLLLQRLYLASRALLRPSHGYYNLMMSVLLTNPSRLCDSYYPMLRTKTNLTTDREQYTRSNAATARPLILVRSAEI